MAQYFNKNLRHIRKMIGLSQQELADKINVDRSSISRWENEDMEATVDNAIQIAKVMQIPIPEFLETDMTNISMDGIFELINGNSYQNVMETEKVISEILKTNKKGGYIPSDEEMLEIHKDEINTNDFKTQDEKLIELMERAEKNYKLRMVFDKTGDLDDKALSKLSKIIDAIKDEDDT